jgi:tRNA(Met) C34 N-acetyltransferase TmcA
MEGIAQKAIVDFQICIDQFFEIENMQIRVIAPTPTAAHSYNMFIRRRLTHAGNRDHTYSAAAIRSAS